MEKEWFEEWFDTKYYHILYQNRDEDEAKRFIKNLVGYLNLDSATNVLDLACGKGRHSLTLSEYGFNVLGVDLSPNSILSANKLTKTNLTFEVHDMREVIQNKSFGVVFNLFTSFGYFQDTSDNLRVLSSIHSMLEDNGIVLIDFMNATKVIENLVAQETKTVDGINFKISRRYDGAHIHKKIEFEDEGKSFSYSERVQALTFKEFNTLLKASNFEILSTFGDFDLNSFDEKTSNRLIILAQKK